MESAHGQRPTSNPASAINIPFYHPPRNKILPNRIFEDELVFSEAVQESMARALLATNKKTPTSIGSSVYIPLFFFAIALSSSTYAEDAAQPHAGASQADTTLHVEDVTVSAKTEEEKLQDVPIPVTAVSSNQIEATHVYNLRQIAAQVPSLLVQGFNPRNATLTIRGLGSNSGVTNSGLEQGVGVYIDGVYYARPSITVFDLWDISGVDVFKGPQGTAFGKNTTAGSINVTSELPTFAAMSKADLTYGSHNLVQFRGALSGKIADRDDLAFRLSGYTTDHSGDIFNTTHQTPWNDLHSGGVKAQILYVPTETFSLRVIADYAAQKQEAGFSIIKAALPTTLANGSTYVGYYQKAALFPSYNAFIADPASRQTPIDTDETLVMNNGGISAQADAKIFGGHTLTSITAFRWWDWNSSLDGDSLGLPIQTAANLPTFQKQFSEEIRISSPPNGLFDGHLDYTAGLYYFWQHSREHQFQAYGDAASVWYLGAGAPTSALSGLFSLGDISSTMNSYAGFAQGAYHIIPDLNLTGGVRYTYEVKNGTFNSWQNDANPIASLPVAYQASTTTQRNNLAPTASFPASIASGGVTGTANLSYRFNDQVLGYGSYSRGFKGPGLNLTAATTTSGISPTVAPETVDAYELGVKTNLFENKVVLNANLFLEEAYNYQASTYTYVGSRYVSYIGNVGQVQTRGIEVDSHVQLFEGLTANFAATYNDAVYKSYARAQCPFIYSYISTCDLSGQPLAGVSKFVLFGGVEYTHPIDPFALLNYTTPVLTGFLGGDITYRSSFASALDDDPLTRVPAYSVFGLHAGARTSDGNLSMSVWVKNLTNKTYYAQIAVGSASAIPVITAILGEPRVVGATLAAKF